MKLETICVLMFLIFMTLKLTSVIDWSWWWVTAPLWGMIALGVAVPLLIALLINQKFGRGWR